MVFVPKSMFLRFKLHIGTGVNTNTVVQILSRNLVDNMKVIFGGKTIQDTDSYDLFMGYHDLLTLEEDMMLGFTSEDKRKIRTDASDKPTTDKLVAHCDAYDKWYHIPLSHPVLDDHGAYCQGGIHGNLEFQLRLANKGDIVVTSDTTKDHQFELKEIQLEYTTIENKELANKANYQYENGRTFYFEHVHHFKVFPNIDLSTQKSLSVHINSPRRCMKGIMMLFTKVFTAGERDTEEFINTKIKDVSVTINGVPHKLFSDGMKSTDLWPSILKRFGKVHENFDEEDFFDDKFALWIDLRASPDNSLHGDGKVVGEPNGIRLEVTWDGTATVNCHVFVVSDSALFVKDGRVKQHML